MLCLEVLDFGDSPTMEANIDAITSYARSPERSIAEFTYLLLFSPYFSRQLNKHTL